MDRFEVITLPTGKYAIRDTANGHFVRFGFNNPPLHTSPGEPVTEWNNWYSAREFSRRLGNLNACN
jgi:hypothetical protein